MSKIKEVTKEQEKFKRPPLYQVVLYNDDFTSADFVVEVLIKVFRKNANESFNLMRQAHETGQALIGVYHKDIAISKTKKAEQMAASAGFPLTFDVVEEE